MSLLIASRTAQRPLVADFVFNYDDTMVDTSGATKNFGSSDLAIVADAINLPRGCRIIGGGVHVETAFGGVAGTGTISVGFSDDADVLTNNTTVDLKTAAHTPLDLDAATAGARVGSLNPSGLNIRITTAFADNATSGRCRVWIMFVQDERADEVYPS